MRALLLLLVASLLVAAQAVLQPVDPKKIAPPIEGSYTIVVLPDTQYYTSTHPELLHAQVDWIVRNREKRNIRFVVHLGDMVQNNTRKEWTLFRNAYKPLDGKIAYSLSPGNHDMGPRGRGGTRKSRLSEYFPVGHFQKMSTFGGVYDKEPTLSDNNFHRFEAGGTKWLILALEFCPRDDILRWANEVVAGYTDHRVLLTTHAYMNMDGRRYDKTRGGFHGFLNRYGVSRDPAGFNDGESMWKKLVSRHRGFSLVLSGHACIATRLSDRGKEGTVVHQMLVDYQVVRRGGDGWLRLLEFDPDRKTLRVRDYSPSLDKFNTSPRTHFELNLDET